MRLFGSGLDVVLHGILLIHAVCILTLMTAAVGRRAFREEPERRAHLALLGGAIVAAKIGYILLFVLLLPDQVVQSDGQRYLFEIRGVAEAPWLWNPVTGQGPGYQVTPKLGMSWVYGIILFLHQVDSVFAVLVINVVIAYATTLVVLLLTCELGGSATAAFLAAALTAIYPETLYWNARILRETLALLLVPLLVYVLIHYFRRYRLGDLLVGAAVTFLLVLTRAQLALFVPLIVVYHLLTLSATRRSEAGRGRALLGWALIGFGLLVGLTFIADQVSAAAGQYLIRYLVLDPTFWNMQWDNLWMNAGQVFSVVARQEHGAAGLLLAPFAAVLMALLLGILLRFGQIFRSRRREAGLLLFLVVVFLGVLAMFGLPNIRFRAMVAPLEIPLVSVGAVYYWRRLGLAGIRILPVSSIRAS